MQCSDCSLLSQRVTDIPRKLPNESRRHLGTPTVRLKCAISRSRPERPIEDYDGLIVGGPIHGGKHPRQLVKCVSKNCKSLNERPSAFFSLSLSAAGNEEQQGDATRCLNEFVEQTGWQPNASTIVAGALLYRKYGFFKRWMMKMIVKRGGGDTDTSRDYVYTDWESLDEFANEFADQLAERIVGLRKSALA